MLNIFRTNQLIVGTLLIFYAAYLRLPAFLYPYEWEPGSMGVLSQWVYEWIGYQGWLPDLVALVLIFLQGIMINAIVFQFRMSHEINLLPGLFYILIGSLVPEFYHLSPPLMANTFYILAIWGLFGTYKVHSCADRIFNIGMWVSIASLFYFSYLLFVVLAIIGLNILRAFQLKERLMVLVGAIVPYFYIAFYFFWYDKLDQLYQVQFLSNFAFFDLHFSRGMNLYVGGGAYLLFILIVLLGYSQYTSKKQIQVQKMMNILFWAMLLSGLSVLMQADIRLDHLLILNVPLGIFIAESVTLMPRRTAEAIHWMIIFGLFFLQYNIF